MEALIHTAAEQGPSQPTVAHRHAMASTPSSEQRHFPGAKMLSLPQSNWRLFYTGPFYLLATTAHFWCVFLVMCELKARSGVPSPRQCLQAGLCAHGLHGHSQC